MAKKNVKRIEFALERPAKKSGGDRYSASLPNEEQAWVVYFPQSLSRVEGKPKEVITVSIED